MDGGRGLGGGEVRGDVRGMGGRVEMWKEEWSWVGWVCSCVGAGNEVRIYDGILYGLY